VKLKYKAIDKLKNQSILVERMDEPNLDGNWHFHEEFELIYNIKGEGIRVVGDNLSNFKETELVLVGSSLPHLWKNEEGQGDLEPVDVVIVKFGCQFSGQDIFSIPEFAGILDLLKVSQRGAMFKWKTIMKVHPLMVEMATMEGAGKIITLLKVLQILSECDSYKLLSSPDFTLPTLATEENRLSKIINYISNNFTRQVNLDDISKEAAMTTNSLCRFFKNRTNKTIFQFINEFRIGKACQLLINGNLSISQICFDTGFNSLTSFNRVFKDFKKVTPREYKKKYEVLNT